MGRKDQGISAGRYSVTPRTLIFITRGDDRVLLLKGSPGKRLWPGLYNGIGGHIERGESAIQGARRELLEETGLVPHALWLCGCVLVDAGEATGVAIYVFRGSSENGEVVPSGEGTLEWVPYSRVKEFPLVEDLYQLLPKVLEMRPGEAPFSALYTYDDQDRLVVQIE